MSAGRQPGMPSIRASRQLVLARLGAPTANLPGEFYRHRSPGMRRVYDRYGEYLDQVFAEDLSEDRADHELESFIVFLEGEHERDYEAFHFGRELLLNDLCVHVDYPSADPEPAPRSPAIVDGGPSTSTKVRKYPSWARRKRGRAKPGRATPRQLRVRVLERLGRPGVCLPGEYTVQIGTTALHEISAYFDGLDHEPITAALIDDAIERLAALRERDWQAFCYGRTALLGLLPIYLELPKPVCVAPVSVTSTIAGAVDRRAGRVRWSP